MRVAHLTSSHRAKDTRIFWRECVTLAKAGMDVTLWAPSSVEEEMVEGVRIKSVGKNRTRFSRFFIHPMKLFFHGLFMRADILHFHDPEMLPVALALRLFGKKIVFDIHENYHLAIKERAWLPDWSRHILVAIHDAMESLLRKFANGLVAAWPMILDRIQGSKTPCILLNNYPRYKDYTDVIKASPYASREAIILYVGGLTRVRGIKELVLALEKLPTELNASLVLAGDFESAEFREEIQALPGWKKTTWKGFVDPTEVINLQLQARVGVILFHPTPHHMHAQPNKIFEYFSFGIPVIASDLPTLRKNIEETQGGILVDPLSPVDISKKIETILGDKKLGEKLGENGRNAVKNLYNWQNEESKLINLYKQISVA